MWGKRDEAQPARRASEIPQEQKPPAPRTDAPAHRPQPAATSEPAPRPSSGRAEAQIGKSIVLNGEISGNEDLYVDGEVHGKITLETNHLTVGPNGKVHADVTARFITILGYLKGDLQAQEKVDIRKTGSVEGQLVTAGIMIEEGAVFRGSIDIIKPGETQKASKAADTSANAKPPESNGKASVEAQPKPEPAKSESKPPAKPAPASETRKSEAPAAKSS